MEYIEKAFLEKRLLLEVIEELNRKQHIPLSFLEVSLRKESSDIYKGKLKCSEPQRVFSIDIEARLKNKIVTWKTKYSEPFSFELLT
jgi:hypothetical protein